MASEKACIIGLDGMGYDNLAVVAEGLGLPSISRLLREALVAQYPSIPPYTPSAWTSIFTGVNPGKHCVYGFYRVEKRGEGLRASIASSLDVAYPRVFEQAALQGARFAAVNVPLTYPVRGVVGLQRGVLVSDWASPRQFIEPRSLEEKYRDSLVEPPHRWGGLVGEEEYASLVAEYLEKRMPLYYDLLESRGNDLFVIVFSEPDWLMHRVPGIVSGEKLGLAAKTMKAIDGFLGAAMKECGLVVVASDHGFQEIRAMVSVNRVLAEKGLLSYSFRFNPSKLSKSPGGGGKGAGGTSGGARLLRTAYRLLKPLLPPSLLRRIGRLVPVSTVIELEKSAAAMVEPGTWGVYVRPGYHDAVVEALREIRLVERIVRGDELFWGPCVDRAPDYILVPRRHVFFDTRVHVEPVYSVRAANHSPMGVIAFWPPAERGKDTKGFTAYDVAPTVMAYLGLPVPRDSDGRVVEEALPPEKRGRTVRMDYRRRYMLIRRLRGARRATG